MQPFAYGRAATTAAARAAVKRDPNAAFLAGGTSIIDLTKIGSAAPSALIDINDLPLGRIETMPDGRLHIGALARMNEVADDPVVGRAAPAVTRALALSASPQLRNMASIGGNIMQRTRWVYFRDIATPCNKRVPGSGCTAIAGDNRRHALLGASPECICTHPSDFAVAMLLTDATIHIAGDGGERTIPFGDLHRLPGATPWRDTNLTHGDLITGVSFVPSTLTQRSAYLKIRDRASFEFALVSVAAGLDVGGGTIRDARLGLGGVAPIPWRSLAAERTLRGRPATDATYAAAADAALADARPRTLNAFKLTLAKRAIVRALRAAGGAA